VANPLNLPPEADIQRISDTIKAIGDGMQMFARAGLNRRALRVLIKDSARGVTLDEIDAVLDSLERLPKTFLQPIKP
jgi:hypothetical protein